jgi:hypothetical protein
MNKPQTDNEQQHGDPDLGKQIDLIVRADETQHSRSCHYANRDISDQDGLSHRIATAPAAADINSRKANSPKPPCNGTSRQPHF